MSEFGPVKIWKRLLARPNEDLLKTLVVAFLVAFTASIFVSLAAVYLRPFHVANLEQEHQARMAAMLATLPGMEDILSSSGVDAMEVHLVDLSTGAFATHLDAGTYDQRDAASDPQVSVQIAADADVAGIKQRAPFAPVFILRKDGDVHLVVLPVRGVGYQSMIYAYLALNADGNTIAGLTVYEQGETPGIGARVQEPAWQALWPGKQLVDENGTVRITVVRGEATGPFEVDGISGATRTSNGVSNMLHFWLGDSGFGPFLTRLREGEI